MELFATTNQLVSSLIFSLLLLSCSGSGGGVSSGNTQQSTNTTTPSQLADALIRKSGDAEGVTDLWRCLDEDYAISYLAVGDFGGVQESLSFPVTASQAEQNIVYDWKTVGSDALELTKKDGQLHESFSYIVFSTVRSLSMVSSTRGYLSCSYHSTEELQSLNMQEMSVGDVLSAEPLLPVIPPDGIINFHSYMKEVLYPLDGSYQPQLVADGLYANGQTPALDRIVFQYGPSRFALGSYYAFHEGKLNMGSTVEQTTDATSTYYADLMEQGRSDERIDGCFHKFNRSDLKTFGPVIITNTDVHWCFSKDGTFTVQSYDFDDVGDRPVTFASTANNTGRYRIDGYAQRLQFNNGFQIKTAFAWFDRTAQKAYLINHYPKIYSQ
ncbi:MAG: hypothetical protein V3U65_13575 [Granulosicoccaceae bacterium]